MNAENLLNTDLGALRAVLAQGVSWWLTQLRELLPRSSKSRKIAGPLLLWSGGALTVLRGGNKGQMPSNGARITLAIPDRLAFVRALPVPQMSAFDLQRMVDLEAERLSPLPRSGSLITAEFCRTAQGSSTAEVAVIPRAIAEQGLQAVTDAGLEVGRLCLLAGDGSDVRFDFTPALRTEGLLPRARSPGAIWWAVVGFAFLLNIAVLIVRDEQSVSRLAATAQQQEPAVAAAHVMQTRGAKFEASARNLGIQRQGHDVFAALALVSEDLPAGAWVQRFTYGGRAVRLVGYKRKEADVIAALRKDRRVTSVQSNTSQLVSDTPAGEPFDMTILTRPGR